VDREVDEVVEKQRVDKEVNEVELGVSDSSFDSGEDLEDEFDPDYGPSRDR